MASGALIVGFADIGASRRIRAAAMLAATVVAGVSAVLGAAAAGSEVLAVVLAMIWGFGTGVAVAVGPVTARVVLLATMGLVLFGSYPESTEQALLIGVLVAGGGVLQLVLAMLVPTVPPQEAPLPGWAAAREGLRRTLAARDEVFRHAVRLALALGAAAVVERVLPLDRSYWVSLTVLFVMKPGFGETATRGAQRFLGTVAGVVLVTALVGVLDPDPMVIAIACALAVLPAYGYFQASYLIFALSWTVSMVLLIAVLGTPEPEVAIVRLVDNCIGLVLIGAAALIVPRSPAASRAPRG